MTTKSQVTEPMAGTEIALAPSRDLVSNFPTGEEISALVALTRAEALAAAAKFDITTVTGRNSIISVAVTVRDKKVKLSKAADKSKVEHQDIIKEINEGKKTVEDEFQTVQNEVRKPVTDWEDAEKSRVEALKLRLAEIAVGHISAESTTDNIERYMDIIARIKTDETWQEYQGEAAIQKDKTLEDLQSILYLAQRREEMEAELAERRAADAEREELEAYEALQVQAEVENIAFDQAIKDAEIKRAEDAEAERRQIEQAAADATKAAEDKAEADRVEAEAEHKRQLEATKETARKTAERKAVSEQAERDAATERQAKRDNNKKLRNAAMKAIATHIKSMNRDEVLAAIMANEIPHVKLIL